MEKTQPFFPLFFQKKTFIFVFFRAARGGIGKNPYVYVYVYIYIYRVSSLHRPSDEEETKPPSAVPLRGTAPGTFIFWENFPKKFLKPNFFLKFKFFFGDCKLEIGKKSFFENFKVQNSKKRRCVGTREGK